MDNQFNSRIFFIFVTYGTIIFIFLILNKSTTAGKLLKIFLVLLAVAIVAFLIVTVSFGGFGNNAGATMLNSRHDSLLIFAHRGVVGHFPENSIESVGEAKRLGFTAVEFDLRKSADGDFILFHDKDAARMLGSNQKTEDISTAGFSKMPLIQKGLPTEFFVPTLGQVLDLYSGDFVFYFDMKLTSFSEADQIVNIIRNYGIEKSVIVASADYLFNLYIEYKYPEIYTALEGLNAGKEWSYRIIPKNLKPDYLSGFFNKVDGKHIKWLKKNELLERRIVYGIDGANYSKAKVMGIRNMILDYDTINPVFNELKIISNSRFKVR